MIIDTPIGKLTLAAKDGFLTRIYFEDEPHDHDRNDVQEDTQKNTSVLNQAAKELNEYFAGKRKIFTVPINPPGAPFCKKVWDVMVKELTFGKTISYGELASLCGHPRAARAVGMANNRNPIPVIIPCHRVVGKNGKLVGFRWGLGVKEKFLALESPLSPL